MRLVVGLLVMGWVCLCGRERLEEIKILPTRGGGGYDFSGSVGEPTPSESPGGIFLLFFRYVDFHFPISADTHISNWNFHTSSNSSSKNSGLAAGKLT